jgi:hypothetical protein
MNTFQLFLQLGVEHITDLTGYDHILFLITLCGVYMLKEWRLILILITAFTIGHSLSLAASVLQWVTFPSKWIEFLIPITILITSIGNLFKKDGAISPRFQKIKYALALFFGLIHGLGFSNYLKSILDANNLVYPLFSFNVGIEIGQLIIVSLIVLISTLCTSIFKIVQRDWNLVISGIGLGISFMLAIERLPF